MATPRYVTVIEVQTRLGVTLDSNDQTAVNDMIVRVEGAVDTFCRRKWNSLTTETEKWDGDSSRVYYYTRYAPISSVTNIKVGTKTLTEGTDYYVYKQTGKIKFKDGRIKDGNQNVEIVYTWGGETVPDAVKNVIIEIVVRLYERLRAHQHTGGADSLKLADASVSFTEKELLPDDLKEFLKPYRRWLVHTVY